VAEQSLKFLYDVNHSSAALLISLRALYSILIRTSIETHKMLLIYKVAAFIEWNSLMYLVALACETHIKASSWSVTYAVELTTYRFDMLI
jgi:hypothetical protein